MGVAVAMSGGVDSSVCAFLLKQKHQDVVGITLRLTDDYNENKGSAICNAREVCKKLGIKHTIVDVREDFHELIINNFKKNITDGKTIIPCVFCNQLIKLGKLLDLCSSNGFKLATGHYARIVKMGSRIKIYKAKDILKDQTHFLAYLKKERLKDIELPLGDKYKSEIFKIAKDNNLIDLNSYKESQDVCFFNGYTYKDYIKSLGIKNDQGDIIHCITLKKLGTHNGLLNYTTGQRKGIDVSWVEPLYVVARDFHNNILYVGEENCLYYNELVIDNVNIIDEDTENKINNLNKIECKVCLRDKTPLIDAIIDFSKNRNKPMVYLKQKARAITSGQICAMYSNDGQLLGGGEIV